MEAATLKGRSCGVGGVGKRSRGLRGRSWRGVEERLGAAAVPEAELGEEEPRGGKRGLNAAVSSGGGAGGEGLREEELQEEAEWESAAAGPGGGAGGGGTGGAEPGRRGAAAQAAPPPQPSGVWALQWVS